MRSFSKYVASFAFITLLVTGCGADTSVPKISIPTGSTSVITDPAELQKQLDLLSGTTLLVCSAGLPASAGGVVSSGVASPIEVSASGGIGPYRILNSAVAFASQTVLSRTYTNNSSTNVVQVDTVSVIDNNGSITQCNFAVTVKPAVNPSTLACTLTSNPQTAAVNSNISLLATASGGMGTYNFSNLSLDTNGSVVTPLTSISSTQASATVKFSASGMKTNNVRVTDSSGTFVVCSSSVTINSLASVNLVATPSVSVPVGSIITVTAVPSSFSSTPSYSFTTSEAGISIIASGSSATVTTNNGLPHSGFTVQVVASNGSQSAVSTIQLSFTAGNSPLICNLSHPAGTYRVGDAVNFSVSATNGDSLEIQTFVVTSDAVVVNTGFNTRRVTYANPGTKYVYALAKSLNTNQWCNDGNYLVDTQEIINAGGGGVTLPLTCNAYTNYNPTSLNQSFYAYAVLAGGNPLNRWVESVRVLRNGSPVTNYTGYWYDRYTAVLAITSSTSFNAKTTYQVELTAKDNLGNTAICSTNHIVQ